MSETAQLEATVQARIGELKARARALQHEIHTLGGKITNRAPDQVELVLKKNEALRLRAIELENTVFALLNQSFNPTQAEDLSKRTEVLRKATVDHCQHNNIDPELWKNLAY